jgi:hypothetical protein
MNLFRRYIANQPKPLFSGVDMLCLNSGLFADLDTHTQEWKYLTS